jgi:hypothetical protein
MESRVKWRPPLNSFLPISISVAAATSQICVLVWIIHEDLKDGVNSHGIDGAFEANQQQPGISTFIVRSGATLSL